MPSDVILVVDGNNVMGAAADGWWRDRRGAVRRLHRRLVAYRAATGDEVVLALDVPQPDLPAGDNDGVEVAYPARRGRDAADDRIAEEVTRDRDPASLVVITSDRGLAERVRASGASVEGAGTLLTRLDALEPG